AGLGNMGEFIRPASKQVGKPGYEGHLNNHVACIARVMDDAGYHTYMAGKWHMGEEKGSWPADKGFERDFSLLQGGGSNWRDMMYPNPAHPHSPSRSTARCSRNCRRVISPPRRMRISS